MHWILASREGPASEGLLDESERRLLFAGRGAGRGGADLRSSTRHGASPGPAPTRYGHVIMDEARA